MKLFKKLKAYNKGEINGSIFGLGAIKARNYDTDTDGHLLLFSINFRNLKLIKKLFVRI